MAPRKVIAQNPANFDLLLLFLSSGSSAVSELAWALLELLPQNETMHALIKNLDGAGPAGTQLSAERWCEILDGKMSLTLAYKLSIALELMFPQKGVDGALPQDWSASFLALGGVEHLVKLALRETGDFERLGILQKRCYSALYRVIAAYLPCPHREHFYISMQTNHDLLSREAFGCLVSRASHVPKSMEPIRQSRLGSGSEARARDVVCSILNSLCSITRATTPNPPSTVSLEGAESSRKKTRTENRQEKAKAFMSEAESPSLSSTRDDCADIISPALEVILSIATEFPGLFPFIASHERLCSLMHYSLVLSTDLATRTEAASKLLCLLELACKQDHELGRSVFELIASLVPLLAQAASACCMEGFGLVSQAVSLFGPGLGYDKQALVASLCDLITYRPIVEASPEHVDWVLTG
jgi:hypothetical protein